MISLWLKIQTVRLLSTIRRVVTVGTSSDTFHEDNYRVRLVNGFSTIIIVMLSFFTVVDSLRTAWVEVSANVVTIMLFALPIYLNHSSKQYQARVLTVSLGMLATVTNIFILGPKDLTIALFLMSGCVSCIVFPPREVRTTSVFLVLTVMIASLFLLGDFSELIPSSNLSLSSVSRALNLLAIVLVLSGLFLNSSFETSRFLKRLTDSVTAQQQALHQSQANARLASVGELAAGVAHEINNPLAIISGHAWRIKKRSSQKDGADSEYVLAAEKILATVERVSQITKGMLDFARKGDSEGSVAELDALDAVRTTANLFNELGKSQSINAVVTTDLAIAVAKGNSGWIQQILLNLLSNAKFASLNADREDIPAIAIKMSEIGKKLVVEVCDFGDGIPAEIEARLMEPFFTTKPVGAGTGLGLSISKGLAQSMGGDLTIVSRKNPTTFRLTLQLTLSARKSDLPLEKVRNEDGPTRKITEAA